MNMPKKTTGRQLAEFAESSRSLYLRDVLEVEYRKHDTVRTLTHIRFGRNDQARRVTKRFMECLDNGTPTNYDKKCEFEVVAITVNGHRTEFS